MGSVLTKSQCIDHQGIHSKTIASVPLLEELNTGVGITLAFGSLDPWQEEKLMEKN